MKNTLVDVNNILIEELERLNDDQFTADPDILKRETEKAAAMVGIANAVIQIGQTQLQAYTVAANLGYTQKDMPLLLGNAPKEKNANG